MENFAIGFGVGGVCGYLIACFWIQRTVLSPMMRLMDEYEEIVSRRYNQVAVSKIIPQQEE
jgi:hypothetical protein